MLHYEPRENIIILQLTTLQKLRVNYGDVAIISYWTKIT